MKKKNILCAVLSNAAIILLVTVLFFVCKPFPVVAPVFAPYYSGEKDSGNVSLMFNVYERSDNVRKILTILNEKKVSCTFFVGGVWAEKNMDLLREMPSYGELGNHGYLHKDHKTLSVERNKEEILLCHKLVETVTGIRMNLFAPPSGSYGEACLNVCKENGYSVIMWSKDTIDWRDKDRDLVLKRATSDIQSGDLILMHPTDHTVEALPLIIDTIKQKGFRLVTVSETLGL